MQKRGQGAVIRYALADSPLGRMLVARTEVGLCAVAFGDGDGALVEELYRRYPEAAIRLADDGLGEDLEQVLLHLAPESAASFPELDLAGTAFEQTVWTAMRAIPRGTTREYGEFAASLGLPNAARAVGTAIGKNPIAVLNPCHRLVARGGALHRYHWGVERKRWLLALEGADLPGPPMLQSQGKLPLEDGSV